MGDGRRRITIRSGTVDELGDIPVRLVNIYARPEKPGGLSVLMIAGEGEGEKLVLGIGEEVFLGDARFRLEKIVRLADGAHDLVLSTDAPKPANDDGAQRRSAPVAMPALAVNRFRDILELVSEPLLTCLVADGKGGVSISGWDRSVKSSTSRDWTGEEWGPSYERAWAAQFPKNLMAQFGRLEASIRVMDLRYAPNETARVEVSGWWAVGARHMSLFARADPPALFEQFYWDRRDVAGREIILGAIADIGTD